MQFYNYSSKDRFVNKHDSCEGIEIERGYKIVLLDPKKTIVNFETFPKDFFTKYFRHRCNNPDGKSLTSYLLFKGCLQDIRLCYVNDEEFEFYRKIVENPHKFGDLHKFDHELSLYFLNNMKVLLEYLKKVYSHYLWNFIKEVIKFNEEKKCEVIASELPKTPEKPVNDLVNLRHMLVKCVVDKNHELFFDMYETHDVKNKGVSFHRTLYYDIKASCKGSRNESIDHIESFIGSIIVYLEKIQSDL
jgi:hypothetical protein